MNHLIIAISRFCLGLSILAFPVFASASLPQASSVPGGIAVVPLCSLSACTAAPQVRLDTQKVLVTSDNDQWYALVGLSLSTKPGTHVLDVKMGAETKMQPFEVLPKTYPEQHITLTDKSKIDLSPRDLARALREIAHIHKLEHHWRNTRHPHVGLALPAKGVLGGRFGVRRFFNGEERNPHSGLDVVVPEGTPVGASEAGVVLATGNYFFNGKTVFVDHGDGLITLYCHMQRIKVKPGQAVKKGQLLGLAGKTGRASGPHIHWSVVLNGTMVDPELFVPTDNGTP